jgi:hypothetical protein
LINPKGDTVLQVDGDTPGYSITTIDLSEARDDNHLRDRRPELYGEISAGTFAPEPQHP